MISHGWMSKSKHHTQRLQNTTLYATDIEAGESLKSLWPQIREALSRRRKTGEKRLACPLSLETASAIFIKSSTIDSIPARIRTTLGIKRRSGLYDWALEELNNHAEAQKRTTLVPKLLGYGLVRQRSGLVTEVFLNYENLANWLDGFNWLQQNPSQAQPFAEACLKLITELNQSSIYHLDLWAGNVMIQEGNLEYLKVIDLENCYIGENPCISETLGFQFAFLYQHQLHGFISESFYDQLVGNQLARLKDIELPRFQLFYAHFKHHGAGRKERHLIPKTGELERLQPTH